MGVVGVTSPLATYVIGLTTVEVFDDCVRTLIQGRPELVAAPNPPDTMRETIDHELGHVWIAWVIAGRPSLALQVAATRCLPQTHITDLVRYEEEIVCSFTLGLRARRGDHRRPWDACRVGVQG